MPSKKRKHWPRHLVALSGGLLNCMGCRGVFLIGLKETENDIERALYEALRTAKQQKSISPAAALKQVIQKDVCKESACKNSGCASDRVWTLTIMYFRNAGRLILY